MGAKNDKKQILTVATAHLDTIWNWDLEYVISKCIPKTLNDNFRLFEQFPEYKFNFEGSYRYELMEEYYPELFKRMCEYVKEGKWNPCGSSFENGDVNVPSPEALFRNILIGNEYFYNKFGIRTNDIFLPDCFGFGWALPSIAHHANLKGFTTQKLSWGSAYGNPFDMGKWYGVDGNFIYGVLRPGSYTSDYSKKKYINTKNLRTCKFIKEKLDENEKYNLDFTVSFHGVGDQGGAPTADSVAVMHKDFLKNGESNIEVVSAAATEPFEQLDALSDEVKNNLPSWNEELVMTYHAVGGYTSRAIGKRWNRRNEELADAAERTACAGEALGVMEYPKNELNTAWKRVIAHHFHDDLPGTSVQRAYRRSWNDLSVSLNQFANEYTRSVGAVSSLLNTNVSGNPVVVSNTLEFKRKQAVSVTVDSAADYIRVFDGEKEVLSQTVKIDENKRQVTFLADMDSLSVKVFNFKESKTPCEKESGLSVSESFLENENLKVSLNDNGEIESIFDKSIKKELLSSPIRFDIFEYKGTHEYPAWEIDYAEIKCEPQYKATKKSIEIVENGAAKVAVKVTQTCDKSTFTYVVSLSSGSKAVEVMNEVEWRDRHRLLKTRFPLSAHNEKALYDLGLGAIERKNNTEKLYEVPAQKWADITDENGEYGISVLSDCKYGWDKPDDNTLRLTAIHTPQRNFHDDSMQSMMDLGLNRYGFAIIAHAGKCGRNTQQAAREFTMPMEAFSVDKHDGKLGREYVFGGINNEGVIIRAIKKAENSDKIVIRVNEGENTEQKDVKIILGDGIVSAREIYASEEEIVKAKTENGCLKFDMKPYEIKSFAVTLEKGKNTENKASITNIELPYNIRTTAFNGDKDCEEIPGVHYILPAEQFPLHIKQGIIDFKLAPPDQNNALLCDGEKIDLPEDATKLYILAASLYGDREEVFEADEKYIKTNVSAMDERFGGWDLYDLEETAFTKTDSVAFEFTHAHNYGKDIIAKQSYLFCYEFDVRFASSFYLPKGKTMLCFAAATSDSNCFVKPLSEQYDNIKNRKFTYSMDSKEKRNYLKYKIIATFKS